MYLLYRFVLPGTKPGLDAPSCEVFTAQAQKRSVARVRCMRTSRIQAAIGLACTCPDTRASLYTTENFPEHTEQQVHLSMLSGGIIQSFLSSDQIGV